MTALLAGASLLCAFLPALAPASASDWIIPAGVTVTYDTSSGAAHVRNFTIESGGKLLVVGTYPFRLDATRLVVIEGTLDLSGSGYFPNQGVTTLNTTNIIEPGRPGGPGGGVGGTGNPVNFTWTTAGGSALDSYGFQVLLGGSGGESGFNPAIEDDLRQAAGGGGGVLGPDLPPLLNLPPLSPLRIGRIAQDGFPGAATATGVLSGLPLPQGGAKGPSPFVDGNPANDFWGRKLDPLTGTVVVGELGQPLAGRGGGAGGNSIQAGSYPPTSPWTSDGDEKGCGGGGGGGLGIVSALGIRVGSVGRILCNGGNGGLGELSLGGGIVPSGGSSGGGSGGMIVLQARLIDLRQCSSRAITALGGNGGAGHDNQYDQAGAGGDGGPGIIQLHVPDPSRVLLLPSQQLDRISVPPAHVLLPEVLP